MSLTGKASTGESLKGKINRLEELRGYSAYEVAVINGFQGTEEDWLASLKSGEGVVRYDAYQFLDPIDAGRARINIGACSITDVEGVIAPVIAEVMGDDEAGYAVNLPFEILHDAVASGRKVALKYNGQWIEDIVAMEDDVIVFRSGGLIGAEYCFWEVFGGNEEVSEVRRDAGETLAAAHRAGGVKANAKKAADTQPVRVDSNGFLWVEPASGGVSNPPGETLPSPPIGTVVNNCQSAAEWSAVSLNPYTATIENDTTDYLVGSQSIKFTTCIQKGNLALNVTGKQFRVRFRINSIDPGAEFAFYVSDDNAFSHYSNFILYSPGATSDHDCVKIGEWCDVILPWSALINQDMVQHLSTVGLIRFRFTGGTGSANIQMVSLVDAPKGIVSFTFDDGLVTQYTEAAKILGARNIPATAYIIPDLVGVSSGCMTEEQIISLKKDYNWDIESHWGSVMTGMSDTEIESSFMTVKEWIQSRGLGRGDHFAYPGGAHNEKLKNAASRFFTTARTIDFSKLKGIEGNYVCDPYALRAVSGIGDNPGGHSVANTMAEITRVANNGGWLMLVFHSIGSTATNMYCSADGLARIADHAIASGVEIKTVADAVAGFACGYGNNEVEDISAWKYYNPHIRAVAHRGYSAGAPMNTLAAFRLAKKMGFKYVEGDVRMTADGVPVMIHDETVATTSNGTGNIGDMTLAQAKALDFGSWFSSKYAGEKIPTFEEFLILCKWTGLHPYIEIKSTNIDTAAKALVLVDLVKRYDMLRQVTWVCTGWGILDAIKGADPRARLGYIIGSTITASNVEWAANAKTEQNDVFILAAYAYLTHDTISMCARNGVPLEAWTVNGNTAFADIDPYVSGYVSDGIRAEPVLYEEEIVVPPAIDLGTNWGVFKDIEFERGNMTSSGVGTNMAHAHTGVIDISSLANKNVKFIVDGVVLGEYSLTFVWYTETGGYISAWNGQVVDEDTQYVSFNINGSGRYYVGFSLDMSQTTAETFTIALYVVDGETETLHSQKTFKNPCV